MGRLGRFITLACLTLALMQAGCAAGPHRLYLDRYSSRYPGMSVMNFSLEDVESFIRYFATERGYEIKFADSSDPRVQTELAGEDDSLIWIAEKPGSPAIIFISTSSCLTVTFLQPPSKSMFPSREAGESANVLYAILKDKFGQDVVHLGAPAVMANPQPDAGAVKGGK
jgi:hypothetical protein